MKVEEFFSEGLRLTNPEYWTIFFNFLIYFAIYEHAIKGDTQAIDADFQEN